MQLLTSNRLGNRLVCYSVCVNGKVDGIRTLQKWYAKVIGVQVGGRDAMGAVEVEVSSAAEVTVLWFYDAQSVLRVLKDAHKDPGLVMVRDALHRGHYLLGIDPQPIQVSTIKGE